MSTAKRKIGYYNLIFKKHGGSEYFFDRQHFLNFLAYLDINCMMIDLKQKNKAFKLNFYRYQQLNYLDIVDLTFKSCKYNHSPEYMSRIDGNERPSDKLLDEGEKEITHVSLKVTDVEAEIIFEERRSGITINEFSTYLNKHYRKYNHSINKPNNHSIECGIVRDEDFLESLNSMEEIKLGEVYTDTRVLGSEMLNLVDREHRTLSEEVIVKFKAEPKESLPFRTIRRMYRSIGTVNSQISRIRIYGKDHDNNGIRIDSEILKQNEYITVNLNDNGTVNSQSIFDKMQGKLGIGLNEDMEV